MKHPIPTFCILQIWPIEKQRKSQFLIDNTNRICMPHNSRQVGNQDTMEFFVFGKQKHNRNDNQQWRNLKKGSLPPPTVPCSSSLDRKCHGWFTWRLLHLTRIEIHQSLLGDWPFELYVFSSEVRSDEMRWENQSREEARKTSGTRVTRKPHMSASRTYFFKWSLQAEGLRYSSRSDS